MLREYLSVTFEQQKLNNDVTRPAEKEKKGEIHNLSPTSLTEDSCSRCFDLAHINVTALRYSIICPESVELIKANKAHSMDSGQKKLHVCGGSKRGWFVCNI